MIDKFVLAIQKFEIGFTNLSNWFNNKSQIAIQAFRQPTKNQNVPIFPCCVLSQIISHTFNILYWIYDFKFIYWQMKHNITDTKMLHHKFDKVKCVYVMELKLRKFQNIVLKIINLFRINWVDGITFYPF